MDLLLDDERLNGARVGMLNVRPEREAQTIDRSDPDGFLSKVEYLSQIWSGANVPIIPLNDWQIPDLYIKALAGGHVDGVRGLKYQGLRRRPVPRIEPARGAYEYGTQLAVALLKYRQQAGYGELVDPRLELGDPWRQIYAATLGRLPNEPLAIILQQNDLIPSLQFDDFVRILRPSIIGSLNDLLSRLGDLALLTPRRLVMHTLAYGLPGNPSLRTEPSVLPDREFALHDSAGNIIVVCSPGNVDDVAFLWNLRAAFGDRFVLPIGIPVAELSGETIQTIIEHPRISRDGMPVRSAYVTSVSVSRLDLSNLLDGVSTKVALVNPEDLVTFGPAAGWPRNEVLVWREGKATVVPHDDHKRKELARTGGVSRFLRMHVDIDVPDSPYPKSADSRTNPMNGELHAGVLSRQVSFNSDRPIEVEWPSRLLSAKIVAFNRGVELKTSAPGRAAEVAISEFTGLWEIGYLAHAPLLELLEQMASRTGMAWARKVVRERVTPPALPDDRDIAPTVDDLPDRGFHDFKRALGNNELASKSWLSWAESRGLLVKGFPIECSRCGAKQWIPVGAFRPPIVCRGCGDQTDRPFGARTQVDFKYRLSERLRRVYEHDAIGHLLLLRYLGDIFGGGRLVGMHPGLEIRRKGTNKVEGEADAVLLFRSGDFVLAEVKRSFSSLVESEIEKLEVISRLLDAPWSIAAGCQYIADASEGDVRALEARDLRHKPFRIVLSYDTLLEPHPRWSLGDDPFAIRLMTPDEIKEREKVFVQSAVSAAKDGPAHFMEQDVLDEPYEG